MELGGREAVEGGCRHTADGARRAAKEDEPAVAELPHKLVVGHVHRRPVLVGLNILVPALLVVGVIARRRDHRTRELLQAKRARVAAAPLDVPAVRTVRPHFSGGGHGRLLMSGGSLVDEQNISVVNKKKCHSPETRCCCWPWQRMPWRTSNWTPNTRCVQAVSCLVVGGTGEAACGTGRLAGA